MRRNAAKSRLDTYLSKLKAIRSSADKAETQDDIMRCFKRRDAADFSQAEWSPRFMEGAERERAYAASEALRVHIHNVAEPAMGARRRAASAAEMKRLEGEMRDERERARRGGYSGYEAEIRAMYPLKKNSRRPARRNPQRSFNPVDYHFRWTSDWYTWDREAAVRDARRDRDALAKKLKAEGRTVRKWSNSGQLITRGGIGSGHPQIEHHVTVFMLDIV